MPTHIFILYGAFALIESSFFLHQAQASIIHIEVVCRKGNSLCVADSWDTAI